MISSMMFGYAWLVTVTTLVAALEFTLSPQRVKIGTTGTLTMTCDVTEVDVAVIYNIQIRRETEPGSNYSWEILAEIEAGSPEIPALDDDIINDKDFVVAGIFDKVNPINTYLTLNMNIQKLTYSDARAYRCQLTYKSNITGSVAIVKRKATLSVLGCLGFLGMPIIETVLWVLFLGAEDHDKGQSDTRKCSGRVNKTTLSLVIAVAVLLTTNVMTILYVAYVTVMRRRSQAKRSITDENLHPAGEELLPGLTTHAKHDRPEEKDVESL